MVFLTYAYAEVWFFVILLAQAQSFFLKKKKNWAQYRGFFGLFVVFYIEYGLIRYMPRLILFQNSNKNFLK